MRFVAYPPYRLAPVQLRRLQRERKIGGKTACMLQKVAPSVNGEDDTSWHVYGAVGATWHDFKKCYVVDKRCIRFWYKDS